MHGYNNVFVLIRCILHTMLCTKRIYWRSTLSTPCVVITYYAKRNVNSILTSTVFHGSKILRKTILDIFVEKSLLKCSAHTHA